MFLERLKVARGTCRMLSLPESTRYVVIPLLLFCDCLIVEWSSTRLFVIRRRRA